MTKSPAADLLEWERRQTQSSSFEVDEEQSSDNCDTEALTKAVAAKLRKRRKKNHFSDGGSDNSGDYSTTKSFRHLSKAQRRRLLWEVKLALDQKNKVATRNRLDSSSGTDSEYPEDETALGSLLTTNTNTEFTGYTNDSRSAFTGLYTDTTGYTSRYTDYTYKDDDKDVMSSSYTSNDSYSIDTDNSSLESLTAAELLYLESLMKANNSYKKKNGEELDDDDLEVEEYLDKMGLGMCSLEYGLETCCPWLLCAATKEDDDVDTVKKRGMTEESVEKELSMQEKDEVKGEDLIISHGTSEWNLCGDRNLCGASKNDVLEEDAESTIDWNGVGVGGGTTMKNVAADAEKKSHPTSSVASITAGESRPMTVKERLAQKMGFRGTAAAAAAAAATEDAIATDDAEMNTETKFQTTNYDDECTDTEEEDAVAMAEDALRSLNLPTLGQTCENEMAIASLIAKDAVPPDCTTISKDCPSTPSSKGSLPSAADKNSVPSTPLKAVIVQEDVASPMSMSSSATPVSMKQRIVRVFKPTEVASASTNAAAASQTDADCAPDQNNEEGADGEVVAQPEFEEEGIEQGIDDQPPAIPSTPLKAVLPSTPLPASTQTTPVVIETKSVESLLSAKSKFARAMMKLKTDGVKKNEEGAVEATSDQGREKGADQPPSIPSTPLKAAIPLTPLPKSNPSTPVSAAAAAVSGAGISAVAVSSASTSTKHRLASLAGLTKKEKICEEEEEKKDDDVEPCYDAVTEEGIESSELMPGGSDEAIQPPSIPSTPLKAAIPTTPLPASAQTTPLNDTVSVSTKKKFARAMMKLKKKSNEEQPINIEVDIDSNEDGIESVAPAITSKVLPSSGVGEEFIFSRETPVNGSTPIPSTTPSESGKVINVSELMKTKSSSSPLIKMAQIVKRSKKHNNVEKVDEREVDVTADGDEIERAVPALPDETTAKSAVDSTATEEPKTPAVDEECTDLARVTPTTPMLRLVKALSFHSQASAGIDNKSQADVDAVSIPPSMDGPSEIISESHVPAPAEAPSTPVVEPATEKDLVETPHPPTFSMFHVLANAMCFMSEANAEERKTDSKEDNDVIDPAVAIEKRDASDIVDELAEDQQDSAAVPSAEATSEAPSEVFTPSPFGMMQILGQAMGLMTEDKVTKEKKDESEPADIQEVESKDVAADATNDAEDVEEDKQVSVTEMAEPTHANAEAASPVEEDDVAIATPRDIAREMSIATQRVNNKKTPNIAIKETSDSIEFTQEMSIANQKSRSKLLNIRSKSKNIFSKAKSLSKDRASANETKSQASTAPSVSVNSVSVMSDHTEKVGNLSSTKKKQLPTSKHVLPKNKKEKRWREYTDPSTGMKYYSNGITTTWTNPSGVESSDDQANKPLEKDETSRDESSDLKKGKISKLLSASTTPTPAEKSARKSKDGCAKKSESRLSLLLKSTSRKDHTARHDNSSVCTDNITADSEGNISVTSSPSRSIVEAISSAEQEVPEETESQEEPSHAGANIPTTDSEAKASTDLTLEAEANTVIAPDTTNNTEQKPKKKKKRKKGWREYTCPNTGNKYYSNGTITQWDKPAEFVDANVNNVADAPKCESEKRVTMISFV